MSPDMRQWYYQLAVVIAGGFSFGNLLSDIWHWQRLVFPIAWVRARPSIPALASSGKRLRCFWALPRPLSTLHQWKLASRLRRSML
jgi:hypothetical protein